MAGVVRGNWLACPKQAERFVEAYERAVDELSFLPCAVVDQAERVDYLARLFAARSPQSNVLLFNPQWGENELAQAQQIIEHCEADIGLGKILISTGGSGGRVKFAIHTWETLCAAVEGYRRFWNREAQPLSAVSPLPVCHIGGLMLALRTFLTGGQLWLADPKLEETPPSGFDLSTAHVSLVGAQLRRALDNGVAWLRDCEAVLVGGGPTDQALIDDALAAGIPLYTAYGLTEAAATVALARADEDPTLGEVLPHWEASVDPEGLIELDGPALFQGYLGEGGRQSGPWPTGDRGELVDGRLRVLGRERTIITGGKKVDAELLALRIADWPEVEEALIFGEPHAKWGEAVQAVVATQLTPEALSALARERLMPEMRPKAWRVWAKIPRLANGKPDWGPIREAT